MLSSTLSGGGSGGDMATADSVEAVEAGYGGTHSCPNPEDQCLDGQTCCQISETDYGCCPFVEAVCCNGNLLTGIYNLWGKFVPGQ